MDLKKLYYLSKLETIFVVETFKNILVLICLLKSAYKCTLFELVLKKLYLIHY